MEDLHTEAVWILRKRRIDLLYLEAIFCPKAERSRAPRTLRIWVS